MAVKRIRATVNTKEQERLLMDLDVAMRSVDCPYTVLILCLLHYISYYVTLPW